MRNFINFGCFQFCESDLPCTITNLRFHQRGDFVSVCLYALNIEMPRCKPNFEGDNVFDSVRIRIPPVVIFIGMK